jgi:ferric-dicitrate binding protein FerR (iron transport regulator)/tetratricopeptide (TPR) repeat protein
MTPFEQNLERLLKESYQPESPDPVFVAGLQQRMQATARERALNQTNTKRTNGLRRWIGLSMALAGAIVFVVLLQQAWRHWPARPTPQLITIPPENVKEPPQDPTPLPQSIAEKTPALAPNDSIRTGAGERKRYELPDGSIVFINHDSSIRVESARRLVLERGEIFVKVAPKDGERFVVQTPDKEVTALGTQFEVRTGNGKTSVAVTQGKVKVSGLESLLYAGQQLMPDDREPRQAPRVSELIDWARDLIADSSSRLVPASKYQGGKLVAFDPSGQEARISLRRYHIDVHIEDGFARTTIDQTYFNNEWTQLEGTFYFPLPPDASISRLAMYVNGELMEGGMAERDRARDVFEQIRYTRRDPALLEWLDGSTFKMRVFPLEGRQEKRIILSYTQRLPVLSGKATYHFPAGHDLRVVDSWSAQIRVINGAGIAWSCPTHSLQAKLDGPTLMLSASGAHQSLDRDLQLNLVEDGEQPTRFGIADLDDQRYLMLRYKPKIAQITRPRIDASTHHVILFETSADRDPLLARTQIEIVRTILENIEHSDTFQILTAGTRQRLLSEKPMAATAENIKAAIDALGKVHLIGALDLESALEAAKPLFKDHDGSWLIHVGSGIPAMGLRGESELTKLLPSGVHYAGIGVGKRWDRSFMRDAAARTGGHYTQINPDESVGWRALDFVTTLRLQRWQNVSVRDDSGRSWLLADSSIGPGEELCATARFAKTDAMPKEVVIRGSLGGKAFEQKVQLSIESAKPTSWWNRRINSDAAPGDESKPRINTNAGYAPRTWGKLEIDRLVVEDSAGNRQKIVNLSKSLYVMSPFTSLLVLENAEMYQRFKIDRGRKDHWALYDCPAHIPVHAEPAAASEPNKVAKGRTAKEVLESIMVRNARYIWAPGGSPGKPMTAWEMLTGATASSDFGPNDYLNLFRGQPNLSDLNSRVRAQMGYNELDMPGRDEPTFRLPISSKRPESGGFYTAIEFELYRQPRNVVSGLNPAGTSIPGLNVPFGPSDKNDAIFGPEFRSPIRGTPIRQAPGFNPTANGFITIIPPYQVYPPVSGLQFNGAQSFTGALGTFSGSNQGQMGIGGLGGGLGGGGLGGGNGELGGGIGGLGGGLSGLGGFSGNTLSGGGTFGGYLGMTANIGFPGGRGPGFGFGANAMMRSWSGQAPYWQPSHDESRASKSSDSHKPEQLKFKLDWSGLFDQKDADDRFLAGPARPGLHSSNELLALAKSQTVDWYMFVADLVAFAPGMETWWADVEATLQAEATDIPQTNLGRIDEAARKIIERARHTGWRSRNVAGNGWTGGFSVTYDGAGRFVLNRTLSSGLREQILNDGESLLCLYPEIGVGARRSIARAYRDEFARILPGALPPVEDLARGANVIAIDDHTVSLRPIDPATNKFELLLVLGDDGKLSQRSLVETATGKVVRNQQIEKSAATTAPDLKPDTSSLVVLPLPYRTLTWARSQSAKTKSAHDSKIDSNNFILASQFARCARNGTTSDELYELVQSVIPQTMVPANTRPGLLTLIRAAGESNRLTLLSQFNEPDNPSIRNYYESIDLQSPIAGKPDDSGLLPRLSGLYRLTRFWNARLNSTSNISRPAIMKATNDFVTKHRSDEFGWLAMLLASFNCGQSADEWQSIAELWKAFDSNPALGLVAQYQQMTALVIANHLKAARQIFDAMYQRSLQAGIVPDLDSYVINLPTNNDGESWRDFVVRTTAESAKKDYPTALLVVAQQAIALNDRNLGQAVYTRLAPDLNQLDASQKLAVVTLLACVGNRRDAEELVKGVLKDPRMSGQSFVWRLAADLARLNGGLVRELGYLERALDSEFQKMPDVIDVQMLRFDYDSLLTGYADLITACEMTDTAPPSDLSARAIKFGDRWRSLDPDPTLACQRVARVLRMLGDADQAWEYLTTPLAQLPGDSSSYRKLATELQAAGELALAERALAAAFAAEPTDAQLLWDRAMLLQQLGKADDARQIFRKLAEGQWQPRFDGIKQQAQWMQRP